MFSSSWPENLDHTHPRCDGGVLVIGGSATGVQPNTCALADLKMNRFLRRADEWAAAAGLDDELPPPHRFAATRVDPRSPLELDLSSREISTVLWATGFRPDYSWLEIPAVCDRTGRLRHDGGVVTGDQGLYVLGMPVLRTRASSYIHGAAADSAALADHIVAFPGHSSQRGGHSIRCVTGRPATRLPT